MPTTTRRDVLAGVGFFAGIAVAAPAVAELVTTSRGVDDAKWREFIEGMAWLHPNGRAAAEHAREQGLDLAEFSGVTLHLVGAKPRDLPILTFGDWGREGRCIMVSPRQCGEYRRIERGSDPYVMAPAGKAVRA